MSTPAAALLAELLLVFLIGLGGEQPEALDLCPPGLPASSTWSTAPRLRRSRLPRPSPAGFRRPWPAAAPRGTRRAGRPPAGAGSGDRPVPGRGAAAMSVAIVDYGSGNLHSAAQGVRARGPRSGPCRAGRVTSDPDVVRGADRIVLPGVGAFADCRRGLDAVPGMVEALTRRCAARTAVPRHLRRHAAAGDARPRIRDKPGLDWIPGEVTRDRAGRSGPEDPAYGLEQRFIRSATIRCSKASTTGRGRPARLFRALLRPAAARSDRSSPPTDYGGPITAMVARGNIAGTQFHPEKSQKLGLALIANFLRWRP